MTSTSSLADVQAFLFDVFGTVVDWRGSIAEHLASRSDVPQRDWTEFLNEWRLGYLKGTARIAAGGEGPLNVDVLHREILDSMLDSSKWRQLGEVWGEKERQELVLYWHYLKGWPDSAKGLQDLKKHAIIGTLSNGSVKLLIDMAKNANLPWDVIFCSELLGSYKPNPQVYLTALRHLNVPVDKACMVAAHIYDVRAAGALGFRTVYVRRPMEDGQMEVKTKDEGGEIDYVVNGFDDIVKIITDARRQ